ncbi:response regulator [Heliobacterium undosum]|uniref:Stage 0 sporulation protein A homolog n=1 Tax=Heliomicrobium undosum TaxID=121734 RepID=A0A845L2N5_9FIRM|nr:response regulator [Heliomicrobium undosum]MZP29946.1 response regulator [Heliomicrobium undosum]
MTNRGQRILVVDDESQIRKMLKVGLSAHEYEVVEADTGRDAIQQVALTHPDLVVLDMGLPDIDGLRVVTELRDWSNVPIIIVSARDQEGEKIAALDAGADDYVTKPFGMGELLARIRVALRNTMGKEEKPVILLGGLSIDLARRMVAVDGEEIKLTPTEYEMLKLLAVNQGKVVTHRQILRHIWGKAYEQETHYLRVYIRQLRQKIETNPSQPQHLITEPGIGYRLL